ncbi:MAG: ribonuclease Z [Candidatus Thermoplasmatota archaeon]|jgi:ribonuclease Z|nr:ribonuclease Z [Candidatus Thermoplasmatota archaeon]
MKLRFLGTGGSWPSKRRNPVSIALSSGPTTLLLDCGEGTQRQLLYSSVSPMRIRAVLVTHLHGDHILGLPGLVQTMSLNGREDELRIIGPHGTARSWEAALSVCAFKCGFDTPVTELSPGEGTEVDGLIVGSCQASHSVPALAYRVHEKDRPGRFDVEFARALGVPEGRLWGELQRGRTIELDLEGTRSVIAPSQVLGPPRKGVCIVYTGDTSPSPEMVRFSSEADLLIHEATYGDEYEAQAVEFGHSTARAAAGVALRAAVRQLALVHTSPRYSKDDGHLKLLAEAKEVFPHTIMPEDGEELEVIR